MIAIAQAEFDDDSQRGVTLEWIQSLSPELKDAALYRFCKTTESKPTLVESFTLTQVIYRTISGGSFTESADNVAARTGCDRKTILKGLSTAKEQNIIEECKRPGTSSEYWFKPVEEWLPEPVVRIKDIRTKKVIEFPTIQSNNSVEDEEQISSNYEVVRSKDYPETEQQLHSNYEVVRSKDDHQTDPNNKIVVVNKLIKEQQQVAVRLEDTPTIWRSLPDGNRYAQIPPIHDQAVGVEIQRQMDEEGLTAQSVVKRAIAFSKVPLLVLKALADVGSRLLDLCWKTESELLKNDVKPNSEDIEVVVSLQLSKTLTTMGVVLTNEQMRCCLTEHGEDAMLDAVVQLRKSGLLVNLEDKENYFLNYLQNTVKGVAIEVATPKKPGMTAVKNIGSKEAATFPTEVMQMLKNAEIHLVPAKAEKLWAAYSEKFVEAIAYVDQKTKEGKVSNREGYFVKCLEEGWLLKKPEPEKRDPSSLTPLQQQWYEWACMTGICVDTPVKDLPIKMGVLAVLIPIKDRRQFDPPYDLVAIDMAMREYPM